MQVNAENVRFRRQYTRMAYDIPVELRKLRTRAGLSIAAMATALGYSTPSGYQHWETPGRNRKKYLPPELAEKIACAVVGKGKPAITRDEVFRLAHIDADTLSPNLSLIRNVADLDEDGLNYVIRTVLRNHVAESGGTLETEDISDLATRIIQSYGRLTKKEAGTL